jgi:hypothetical protein
MHSKPSKAKQLKQQQRRKKIEKEMKRNPNAYKRVKNQKAQNIQDNQRKEFEKMLDENQKKMEGRSWFTKKKDALVQGFMRKHYSKWHYFKMNLRKRINFWRGINETTGQKVGQPISPSRKK